MKIQHSQSFAHSVGEKVKQTAEIVGTLKTIYDIGKTVAPMLTPILAAL